MTPISDDPLALAADVGRRVLEAGGETYRAEETVVTLCRAWRFSDVECFATPTGLIASVADGTGSSRAVVRRISRRAVDLRRIARIAEEVSSVERENRSPEEFKRVLDALVAERPYAQPLMLIAAGASACFFTLLFGGLPQDAVAAFFVGIGVKMTAFFASNRRFPDFIVNIAGAAVSAGLSSIALRLGLAVNFDKTVIGSLMLLVPGLALVNAIRDTIAGDLVAGIARLADAFVAAAALSLGAGFALSFATLVGRLLP